VAPNDYNTLKPGPKRNSQPEEFTAADEITKDWVDYDFGAESEEENGGKDNSLFSGVKKMGTMGANMASMANMKKVGNIGGNLMGGLKSMGDRLKNMMVEDDMDNDNNNFGSASDYKSKFLSKYGVSFTIPSMYV
jgi:hypothetical protein